MESETAGAVVERTPEEARVIRWRAGELVRAGYSVSAANVISVHTEVDLHRAVELPRNGCSHELALRILL
jgi:hypothetical protein